MQPGFDRRNISTGWNIPAVTYSDQPYIVKTDDGAWLAVMTTGAGHEGQKGQHIITNRSTDKGQTWSTPLAVESPDGPEASYAVLLKAPGGRIFVFYNHNTDNIRQVIADDPPFAGGLCGRVDSLGHFVFKYSDDHGCTWSQERYDIPQRDMDIDRKNPYEGRLKFFWNVGKPFIHNGAAYVSLHKVGGFGAGFFTRSEGILLKSDNLLTVDDPAAARWETLPDGDFGLCTPPGGGLVAEEQSYNVLSDGSFYAVYRTVDGHPACSRSRDGGHTWDTTAWQTFADGRPMKHPRAANFAWKCANGKYLYWFHNHGGCDYEDRNPVWLCGGIETEGPGGLTITWSQPEIVLYDDDPKVRMSYPDLVEDEGRYYLTETQKHLARVHEVDKSLLEGLWGQFDADTPSPGDAALEACATGGTPAEVPLPPLPVFLARDPKRHDFGTLNLRAGFSVELLLRLETLTAGQIIADNRTREGRGFFLQTTDRGTIEIVLHDGSTENRWDCDPGLLQPGRMHHIAAIVDGGPSIIMFVVDGMLCDGGPHRQFGWGRFNPHYRGPEGEPAVRLAPAMQGELAVVRVYDRALRVSEAVAAARCAPSGK